MESEGWLRIRFRGRGARGILSHDIPVPVKNPLEEIGVILAERAVGARVSEIDAPLREHTRDRAIFIRIIAGRNRALQELPEHLWSVESWLA